MQTRPAFILAQSVVLLAALVGCSGEAVVIGGEDFSMTWEYDAEGSFGDVALSDGRMRGDIGSVEQINEGARLTGWQLGGGLEIEALAGPGRDAAMTLITLSGDLTQLQPGRAFHFAAFGESVSDDDELNIEVVACSGDEVYEWDYDEQADDVIVTCEEGSTPDTVEVTVIATTDDGSTDVTTRFELNTSELEQSL